MLVLTRKKNQGIVINDDITVSVVEIRGGRVRLGIQAPKEVPIRRAELRDVDVSQAHASPSSERKYEFPDGPLLPAPQDICEVFAEEVGRAGGAVSNCFDNGRRLFVRAKLPFSTKVQPKDTVQAGVALTTAGKEIRVHHYTFRQVCRNGAIMPVADRTQRIDRVGFAAPADAIEEVLCRLRDAVRACSGTEAFSTAAEQMKSATEEEANLRRFLLRQLPGIPQSRQTQIRTEIASQFGNQHDRSLFGLMNAVTSVARNESDPEVRWRLEELGGAVPALAPPSTRLGSNAAELVATIA